MSPSVADRSPISQPRPTRHGSSGWGEAPLVLDIVNQAGAATPQHVNGSAGVNGRAGINGSTMANGSTRANGRAGVSGGHGIVGMRERAALFGGSIRAEPQPGGGYQVRAAIPLPAQDRT